VTVNVTVTGSTAPGFLVLYAGGTSAPGTSSIEFRTGQSRANNATVELGGAGDILVTSGVAGGTAHAILDISGYFE
jgi:hypothetical protein